MKPADGCMGDTQCIGDYEYQSNPTGGGDGDSNLINEQTDPGSGDLGVGGASGGDIGTPADVIDFEGIKSNWSKTISVTQNNLVTAFGGGKTDTKNDDTKGQEGREVGKITTNYTADYILVGLSLVGLGVALYLIFSKN